MLDLIWNCVSGGNDGMSDSDKELYKNWFYYQQQLNEWNCKEERKLRKVCKRYKMAHLKKKSTIINASILFSYCEVIKTIKERKFIECFFFFLVVFLALSHSIIPECIALPFSKGFVLHYQRIWYEISSNWRVGNWNFQYCENFFNFAIYLFIYYILIKENLYLNRLISLLSYILTSSLLVSLFLSFLFYLLTIH